MTRVLHVIAEMGVGGAETVVAELVRGGSTVGWVSAVASAGGVRVAALAQGGTEHFSVQLLKRRPSALIPTLRQLHAAVATFGPDVVVAHNVGSTFVTSVARFPGRRSIPLISVFHGVSARDVRAAARVMDLGPDHVVTVSQSLRASLLSAGMRRTDTWVIPNAVSVPVLPARAEARQALGLDNETPVALCLARMVKQKRHDVLLRAWSRLSAKAVLLLAGDGELRPQHERLAHDLAITERVRFLGMRDDPTTLLAAADVSTLASDWEGLPMAVLESMAVGVPFVGTSVDGVAEVVRDGEGILVPVDDPEALAAGLAGLLFDPSARTAMGETARAAISARHQTSQMINAYADLICEVVK